MLSGVNIRKAVSVWGTLGPRCILSPLFFRLSLKGLEKEDWKASEKGLLPRIGETCIQWFARMLIRSLRIWGRRERVGGEKLIPEFSNGRERDSISPYAPKAYTVRQRASGSGGELDGKSESFMGFELSELSSER